MGDVSEVPNGIVPFVPSRALVPVPAVIHQLTDPQVIAALIHDGEWRTTAMWRGHRFHLALQLRQCGEDGAFEARLASYAHHLP